MTSLRCAFELTGTNSISELRAALGVSDHVRLRLVDYPLHIIAYNVAFVDAVGVSLHKGELPDGVNTDDPDRIGDHSGKERWFVDRISERIRNSNADVVCLCEVFYESARDRFKERLADVYPHWVDGPTNEPRRVTPQNSGLLIFSKKRILANHRFAYPAAAPLDLDNDRIDTLAAKGVVHARVEVAPERFADIFVTHLQALYEDEASMWEPLREQLDDLGWFARAVGGGQHPAIVVGDLNVDSSNVPRYQEMIRTLEDFFDAWSVMRPGDDGFTFGAGNNFRGSPRDGGERLDYVMQRSAPTLVPIADSMQVLRWRAQDRDLSDHFPLEIRYRQALELDLQPTPVRALRVRILRFRTLRTANQTDRLGPGSNNKNQIRFRLSVRSESGANGDATIRIDTRTGFEPVFDEPAILIRDPGRFVEISVSGEELNDGWFDDTDLGTRSLRLSADDLSGLAGASRRMCVPRFTREDGDYAVELELSALAV